VRALTIKQPWAFAIAEGFKTVENRSKPTRYRGALAIHAGLTLDHATSITRHSRDAAMRLDELGGSSNFWEARAQVPSAIARPPYPSLALGAVIAVAELVGCHSATGCPGCGPWADYRDWMWHWVLQDVQRLPSAVACTGRQSLWVPDAETLAAIKAVA
jgi:hypothetical protein